MFEYTMEHLFSYTAHPDYLWMNRCLCVGVGEAYLERGEVRYDVYAVR